MISVFVLIGIAVLALIVLLSVARGRSPSITGISDVKDHINHVDLAAFCNLVDPAEEEYLQQHLPPQDFRTIQRERVRAALAYVRCVAGNAAVLLRLGESARQSDDPQVARAGQELVDCALRLRMYVFLAETKLYAAILMPGVRLSPGRIAESYENLSGIFSRLGRLQQYPRIGQIAATL